nr:hypothetical protein [uncultured Methanoregula sp.]
MIFDKRYLFTGILTLLFLGFIAILQLHYYSILFPVLFGILGLIIFIIIDWLSDSHLKENGGIEPDKSPSKKCSLPILFNVLTILFLILFSLSLYSLFLGEYTKTVAYYLCISLCAGILIVEILSYRTQIEGYGILLKAVLLSVNIVFANHLVFIQGISLPDLGLHFPVFVRSILETGHLSSNPIGPYGIFSIHHIFASEIAIVTGYNPLSIYLLFGSFILAIGVLFVFIIGKRFVNFQFGLVAAILFTCLDYYLMYGEHPEHQAYNYGFALICFTIILYTYRFQKPAFYILFAFSAVAMTFTHHLSAAIVFVTVSSLVIIDTYDSIQKRNLSIPSKYIAVTVSLLLFCTLIFVSSNNPVQYVSSVFKPYFMDTYSLVANLFIAPSSVVSVPVTPVPSTSVLITPVPVTPVPITPAPVTSIPPPPYVPPTGYDKLPLITLFENTLGSSLLVLISVWGFCSCIKKRSWFGDFSILNGMILSVLLGLGILFSYVFFLPDRLYPFLQIFGLVFLGSVGILWLHNVFPSRKKTLMIGCICILVTMMSFFSLASIINGFETSPFVGNDVAYPKLYTTSQEVSFSAWSDSVILPDKRKEVVSAVSATGIINIDNITGNHYAVFDKSFFKTGLVKSGGKFGQHSFTTIKNGQLASENTYSSYYDNGLIIMMNNNP